MHSFPHRALALLLMLLVVATGCSGIQTGEGQASGAQTGSGPTTGEDPGSESTESGEDQESEEDAAPPAQLSFEAAGQRVDFNARPKVTVTGGTIESVEWASLAGREVTAHPKADGSWAPEWLTPDTRYRVTATAVNADGASTTREWRFRTTEPHRTDFPAMTPLADTTVGIGHPAVIYFDEPVEFKADVQERLKVTSSKPVEGSWGWLDDRTVAYRPKSYWPADTDVTVTIDLDRVRTSPQVWVMTDREIRFHVGRAQVLRIDDATKQMQVVRDGQVVRTVPVSMGKPGFTTRSGTKIIMTQERTHRMDSTTAGITGAEAYDVEVEYALRLTNSGEFIHAAPWSEWAQGSQNVSHGCVNVSTADGAWLYENTLVGDPVETVGTGRQAETWNGLGGIWNFGWQEWRSLSATA